jgi:hypothetical protein
MNEAPQPVKDWVLWHQAYEDPASSLSRRLAVVRKRLSEVLDAPGDRPTKLLSLCAGDGRDVIPVLAGPPVHIEVDALLVEWDQRLVGRAVVAAEEAELVGVTIRYADAGYPASFADFLPVDVLMLCGIFGNIEHSAVRTVIQDVRPYLRDDGTVIWTRGGSIPDRRPEVRKWFSDNGFAERSFDQESEGFGVGVHQLVASDHRAQASLAPGHRLFRFPA